MVAAGLVVAVNFVSFLRWCPGEVPSETTDLLLQKGKESHFPKTGPIYLETLKELQKQSLLRSTCVFPVTIMTSGSYSGYFNMLENANVIQWTLLRPVKCWCYMQTWPFLLLKPP